MLQNYHNTNGIKFNPLIVAEIDIPHLYKLDLLANYIVAILTIQHEAKIQENKFWLL